MSERDTHFAGFAQMLIQEIDEQVGAVTAWGIEHAIDDEVKVGQELASRWRTLIARRAFDLVTHAFNDFFGDGRVELTESVKGEGALFAASTPDLTEWPKEGQ